jgi:hypothetical protein
MAGAPYNHQHRAGGDLPSLSQPTIDPDRWVYEQKKPAKPVEINNQARPTDRLLTLISNDMSSECPEAFL